MTAVRRVTSSRTLGIALLALIAGAAASAPSSEAAIDSPPNIIIIVTDDQRLDGTLRVMTKTRKWFGDGGAYFPSAVTTTPTCCPARASIFTGRYPHNHGVRTSEPGQANNLDQNTTLQRYLHGAGYRTGMAGKFLNGWKLHEAPPFFDSWAMFATGPKLGYFGGNWNVNGKVRSVHGYSTDFIATKARKFLNSSEELDDQPWFLYLAPLAPHSPSIPEDDYRRARVPRFKPNPAMLEDDRSDKPRYVQESRPKKIDKMARKSRMMLRTLMSVDDLVNTTMQKIEKLDEGDNTLAFFISDNGFLWGEHGLAGKRFPYNGSVQVPLFMRWPGQVEGGAVDDRLVANIDIAPTVLEAVGLTPEHVVDGRSLLDTGYVRDRILVEHWRRARRTTPDWASTRTSSYQYVEHYLMDRLVATETEYYDLLIDPFQLENLLGDTDSANDPNTLEPSLQLVRDVRCSGTSGLQACP